ncbi:MAG TPA: SAV_6107 family HEPN domain-containing protein, partial [Propionibacteriaceae bacterium]|nr:SAV_6107 family HEPN domain-containing protein [Propionibacteriaceae bacterium]
MISHSERLVDAVRVRGTYSRLALMQMDLDPHLHRGRQPVDRSFEARSTASASEQSNRVELSRPNQPEDMMSCNDDLQRARSSLAEAELARRPSDRYLSAHLAALRVVAIVLTHRALPGTGRLDGRPRNAWQMLADVAPELAEWAAFFAATESKRDAIRAGATSIVSAREADDLVRDAKAFLR